LKVEVYKVSAWREMPKWRAGEGPEITLEIEDGLFEFRAPYARVSSMVESGLWWRGGGYEIVRGDRVRISVEGVIVFEGYADQDVHYDHPEGVVRFTALGYMAGLKDVLAGNSGRYMVDGVDHVGGRYRWVKQVQENADANADANAAVNNYEYRVWQHYYDSFEDWQKVAYKQKYLFDSYGNPGELERHTTAFEQVEPGIYRRRVDASNLRRHELEGIFNEIIAQIKQVEGEEYSGVWDPGELQTDVDVKIIDEVFGDMDVWQQTVGGVGRTYLAGWKSSDGGPSRGGSQEIEGPLAIFELANGVNPEEKARITFQHSKASVTAGIKDFLHDRETKFSLYNDYILHTIRRVRYEGGGNFGIFYQLWSWLMAFKADDGTTYYFNNYLIEWYQVDLQTGDITGQGVEWETGDSNEFQKSAERQPKRNTTLYYSHVFMLLGDRITNIVPRYEGDAQNERELVLDDGSRYFAYQGLLYYKGNLAIQSVGYSYEDVAVTDVLKELAVLTNSLLYVDNNRTVYIVSRDHVLNRHRLDFGNGLIESPNEMRKDYFGDRTPQISSSMVTNEEFIKAIRRFYSDSYYPTREEWWEIEMFTGAVSAAIGLLDFVIFQNGRMASAGQAMKIQIREERTSLELRYSLEQ